jgi:hypothetical protein
MAHLGEYRFEDAFISLINDPLAFKWFVAIPAMLGGLSIGFRVVGFNAKTKDGSHGADVMSYEIVACLACCYLTYYGAVMWFGFDGDVAELAKDKIYGQSEYMRMHILIPMFFYQLWNFISCLIMKEFRDATGLVHHVVTMGIAYTAMAPAFQYYGSYFCGVCELSTIFLTFVDLFTKFPEYRTKYASFNSACRTLFAVSFIITRCLYFPYLSLDFWIEVIAMLRSGHPTVHSKFTLGYMMVGNIFLTGLQLFWGTKMLGFLLKTFNPPKVEKADKKK